MKLAFGIIALTAFLASCSQSQEKDMMHDDMKQVMQTEQHEMQGEMQHDMHDNVQQASKMQTMTDEAEHRMNGKMMEAEAHSMSHDMTGTMNH